MIKIRTKLIYSNEQNHNGYGAGSGDTERYEYECACGKGKIVEEHDNIPGFRDHSVYICCENCRENYELDTSKGIRGWDLVKNKKEEYDDIFDDNNENDIIENLLIPINLHNDNESLEIIDTVSPITTFTYNTISELYLHTLKALKSMPYDEYLKSEHWKHFRHEAIIHFNGKCALCNTINNLNVHHKDYTNRGRETFNDVILLCKRCHDNYHKFLN